MGGNDDIFTWFPRREDYEIAPAFVPDETVKEKIARLIETVEANQVSWLRKKNEMQCIGIIAH